MIVVFTEIINGDEYKNFSASGMLIGQQSHHYLPNLEECQRKLVSLPNY